MLKQRILTAAVILPPLALILYFGGYTLIILAVVCFLLMNYEFLSFSTPFDQQRKIQLCLVHSLPVLSYFLYGFSGWGGGVILAAMLSFGLHLFFVERERDEIPYRETLPACFLGLVYTGILGSILVIVSDIHKSSMLLVWLFFVVIFSDTSAYFGGRTFGKRKLSPRISPNKTIAGAISGLCGAVVGSIFAVYLLGLENNLLLFFFYGVVAGVLTQVGDGVESLIKRSFNVKDSGTLFPGHGGILDRVDGLLFAAPILFFIQVVA